jgi:hypothetical protein
MTVSQISQAKLISYAPYSQDPVGFALPIFCQINDPGRPFVQIIDEIEQTIHHFRPLDSSEYTPLHSVPSLLAAAGDRPIYAFIDNREAIIGALPDISERLRTLIEKSDVSVFTRLQIAELIGTREEKAHFRELVDKNIKKLGIWSSRNESFKESVAYTEMWDRELAGAVSRAEKEAVLKSRGSRYLNIATGQARENTVSSDVLADSSRRNSHLKKREQRQFEAHGKTIAEIKTYYEDEIEQTILAGPWIVGRSLVRSEDSKVEYVDMQTIVLYDMIRNRMIRNQWPRSRTRYAGGKVRTCLCK